VAALALPDARDIKKLADATAAMMDALSSLAPQLQEPAAAETLQDASAIEWRQMSTLSSVELHAEQERLSQLEVDRGRLQAREDELQAAAVESADLEHVVMQLRLRVSQLETRESKVMDLRQECRDLRTRLAELIGSTMDHKSLENERADLKAELELREQHVLAKLPPSPEQDVDTVVPLPTEDTRNAAPCTQTCESA